MLAQYVKMWLEAERFSLKECFLNADVRYVIHTRDDLKDRRMVNGLVDYVGQTKTFHGFVNEQNRNLFSDGAFKILDEEVLTGCEKPLRYKLQLAASMLTDDRTKQIAYKNGCFKTISDYVLSNLPYDMGITGYSKDCHSAGMSARVNFAGGWSDTYPYCAEYGGTVLNAAVDLNGEPPVRASARRIGEPVFILKSLDLGDCLTVGSSEELFDLNNLSDSFVLHKACLIVSGFKPDEGLRGYLKRFGGGLEITTESRLPKGSGLGGSSILAAAVIKSVVSVLGRPDGDHTICDLVLAAEQLLATGGGWQDQWGGIIPGIKLLRSAPGSPQVIRPSPLILPDNCLNELNGRLLLIYTGQRRLAKNLLRTIVGKCIAGDPVTMGILNTIQRLAVIMAFELERGNVDAFGGLMSAHLRQSRLLDAGSTNKYVDLIFDVCAGMTAGGMICGAGGGGFLQILLKNGLAKQDLQDRLNSVFGQFGPKIWDFQITKPKQFI